MLPGYSDDHTSRVERILLSRRDAKIHPRDDDALRLTNAERCASLRPELAKQIPPGP